MNNQMILEARFILGAVIVLIASIFKNRNYKINTILALLIIWITFGHINLIYFSLSVILNVFLLFKFKFNEYVFTILNLLILYIYKFIGKSLDPRISGTFDISGLMMIQTVKMSYLSKYFDNNIQNVLGYIFFIPGLITGPIMPYDVYIKRDQKPHVQFPIKEFVVTLCYLISYLILKRFPLLNYVLNDKTPFILKIPFLYLYNISGRLKFYFAWNFAHCCFILNNFPEYLNIIFEHVETPESVSEITTGWNRFINTWLSTLFYKPLRVKSQALAIIVSITFSAFLHGINLGYIAFTAFFSLYRQPVARANEFLKYKILKKIQMIFFVMYFSMPFYLLNMKSLYQAWKSVYFFGHIYFTIWLLICWIEKLSMKIKAKVESRKQADVKPRLLKKEKSSSSVSSKFKAE